MSKFKTSYSLPIVMSDRHRVKDLKEILGSMDDTSISYSELEDYITNLESIEKEFLTNITNNLHRMPIYSQKQDASRAAAKIIDDITILAPSTTEYNCHGWSFGTVHNIALDEISQAIFLQMLHQERELELEDTQHIDKTMNAFFSKPASCLVEKSEPSITEGSIITYSGADKFISHTAKYLKSVKWYNYEEEYGYKEWYSKDRTVINFNESNDTCLVESYTSKLGAGHLVAHKIEDLIPLYGEAIGFFNFSE